MNQKPPKMQFTAWVLGGETLGVIAADGALTMVDYVQVGIDGFADLVGQTLTLPPVTTKVQVAPDLLKRRDNAALVTGMRVRFVGRWREIRTVEDAAALHAVRGVYQERERRIKNMIVVWSKEQLNSYQPFTSKLLKLADDYALGEFTLERLLTQQTAALAAAPSWAREALKIFQTRDERNVWRHFEAALDRIAPRQYVITGVSHVKWLFVSYTLVKTLRFVDPEQIEDPYYQHRLVAELARQRREREQLGLPAIDEQFSSMKQQIPELWSAETAQSSIIPPVRRKPHGTRGLSRRRQRHPENRRQGRTG